jgi:hypothetical protein
MLLNIGREETGASSWLAKAPALLAAVIFGAMVATFSWRAFRDDAVGPLTEDFVSLRGLAAALFDEYLLVFELVGLLLLVAVIAATVLARRPDPEATEAPLAPGAGNPAETATDQSRPAAAAPAAAAESAREATS